MFEGNTKQTRAPCESKTRVNQGRRVQDDLGGQLIKEKMDKSEAVRHLEVFSSGA